MHLLQTIISYYEGESRHGILAAGIGVILLTAGFLLWKWALPFSLLKGFAVPLFLFGLLLGIGGGASSFYTSRLAPKKTALFQKDATAFLQQEQVKVEKTHRGWNGVRIFWALWGLGGLLLCLFISKPFWMGAGLGTLVAAIVLSLFELFSMRFNERYYQAIQSAAAQELISTTNEISPRVR